MIQYQILQTNITRTIWQTIRRVTNEILGVNLDHFLHNSRKAQTMKEKRIKESRIKSEI